MADAYGEAFSETCK